MADKNIQYKCPNCGGPVEFDVGSQQMRCPYCDSVFDVESLLAQDAALNAPQEGGAAFPQVGGQDDMQWQQPSSVWDSGEAAQMGVYTCKSCSGEILADDTTGATQCPFCGNPVVLTARFAGGLKPDLVVPFKCTKEQAKAELKKFMSNKRLLPRTFSTDSHLDEIKGVYVPFWLFDATASASAQFKATRVRHWSDSKYNYTETSYFDVFRAGMLQFDNIPVDGSVKMPNDMMESLEPFNINEARPFQTAYLSGFMADRYDVDSGESIERANTRAKSTVESALASTVSGYASVQSAGTTVQLSNGRAKYALLPVWLLTTDYQGKKYQFAMNGQTGRFVGSMPIDKGAMWKWRLIYTGIIGVIGWAVLFGLSFFL